MIDYTYRQLFHNSSVDKQWIITDGDEITLTNEDIYEQSIKVEESLCSEDHITFGSCEGTTFSFTTTCLTQLLGKKLTVSIILDDNDDEPFLLGTFTVIEDELTADRQKREIKAYDDLYYINNTNVADWYNGLTFPLTLKQFRDSFFNLFNITQETTTLVNDNMTVEKTVDAEILAGSTVLQSICEINGRCGHINRNGIFKYIPIYRGAKPLYPALTLYPSTILYPSEYKPGSLVTQVTASEYESLEYADYDVLNIDKLQIRQEENDIGAIAGTGTNAYIVEDNFLVYGKNAADLGTVATNMFSEINNVTYTPLKLKCIGDPCVEVGDIVEVHTSDGEILYSYIMSRHITGLQALKDEIESQGNEYQGEEVTSLNTEIIQLKGKTTKIEKNVNGVTVSVEDLAANTRAQFEITDQKIATKVATTDFNSTVTQLSNSISTKVESSTFSSTVTQLNNSISTKVTNGTISSSISQEAGQISISANRIAISSNKFTLDNNGKVTCSDMNISGGSLSITKGSVNTEITTAGLKVKNTSATTNYCTLGPALLEVYDDVNDTTNKPYMKYVTHVGAGNGRLTLRKSDIMLEQGNLYFGSVVSSRIDSFGNAYFSSLSVSGTKNRIVKTKNYNTRALNAYETAECYFGDIGEGQLDENGICTIELDPIFLETVNTKIPYQVFLQAYGDGKCWVSERNENNFVVKGTPNMPFGYEIKAKQLGYENNRLEEIELPKTEEVNEDANKLSTDDLGE